MLSEMSHYLELSDSIRLHPMGMAAVDREGVVSVYSSDCPYEHIQEAKKMKEILGAYLSSEEGRDFVDYLGGLGRELVELKGVGAADLQEGTVAAILKDDLEGVILSNYSGKGFEERVGEMARSYGVGLEAMKEYVLAHELTHAAGYDGEREVEGVLKNYFIYRANRSEGEEREKYLGLAKVASLREEETGED